MVNDKYIDSRPSETFKWFERMAKSIAVASYFIEKCPGIFDDIIYKGRVKLSENPTSKYSWLEDFITSDKKPYQIAKELIG